MVRPEQISLVQVESGTPADEVAPDAALGDVEEVDFGGAVCTVTLRLLGVPAIADGGAGKASDPAKLVLHRSYVASPAIGALVRIKVVGEAHVFTCPA
jgi:iron(III) transport system ATP-binding protein